MQELLEGLWRLENGEGCNEFQSRRVAVLEGWLFRSWGRILFKQSIKKTYRDYEVLQVGGKCLIKYSAIYQIVLRHNFFLTSAIFPCHKALCSSLPVIIVLLSVMFVPFKTLDHLDVEAVRTAQPQGYWKEVCFVQLVCDGFSLE